jgi:hypothetical protein
MTDPGLAWLLTLVIVVVTLLILLVAAVIIPRTAHVVRQRFYCPGRARSVMVRFLTGDRGDRIHVLSCTALADPFIVTCDQECLRGTAPTGAPAEQHEVAAV